MVGTGFFPLGYDDTYRTENRAANATSLFLIGTSEVSLVSLHADEIFEPGALPIRYAGISPCFRREAGAAGRDTAGLYRVHQFNKVEQVVFCEPDPEISLREQAQLCQRSIVRSWMGSWPFRREHQARSTPVGAQNRAKSNGL